MTDVHVDSVNAPFDRSRRLAVTSIGLQLAVLEGGIVLFVLILLDAVNAVSPILRGMLELAVAGALGVFAIAGLVEAAAAIKSPKPPPVPDEPMPKTTAIVPAYLPNEAPIILETIAHHLDNGPADLQLIVAYNTPTPMPIEAELFDIAARDPRVVVVRVEESHSKAENVNAALDHATGEIIGVFDADHHPTTGSYERAWRWLANGYDVVQGRCAVRRKVGTQGAGKILTLVVMAEFEQMYTVGHPGRTRVQGFGLFGGSNGYWQADALRAVKLDPSALTEDIDASVRLLRSGGRIIADPGIVSAELPPPSVRALCHQRLRWAQGWFQVARRHLSDVVADPTIAPRQRVGAAWLFGVGTVLPWIGAFTLPLTIHGWIWGDNSTWRPVVGLLFMFGTVAFVAHAAVAYKHALPGARRPQVFGSYLIANLIFYSYLRVALVRLAHLHELAGKTEWRVTPRSLATRPTAETA
jgi:cellulose synthase/poly-beta-1,6-N-acetylglucosamine synthase-like glycosyltransferase